MVVVPVLLLVVVPALLGWAARGDEAGRLGDLLRVAPPGLLQRIEGLPADERLLTLVLGYLLAPLFLVVPLMVSSVIAADAFAGERDRGTLEALLHLPVSERDLFRGKLLAAFVPAVAVSWIGFAAYCVVANAVAWGTLGRPVVPTALWVVVVGWLAPAVSALGLGVMVRVSARARTAQEAHQLGGAVILPLTAAAMVQAAGVLLLDVPRGLAVGAVMWAAAGALVVTGARRFTRERCLTG